MSTKNKLNLSAFILGLTSMIGQIIIIKELIIVFYGNELSLGIILASWLFWVGVGSFLAGFVDKLNLIPRCRERFETVPYSAGQGILSNVQLFISILLPLNIFLIRIVKSILKIQAGEIIGFMPICWVSFLSLSAVCILLGFSFTLISKLATKDAKTPSKEVGRIYLLEGLGASIGGIIYSFFLIKALTPFQNILIISTLNLLTSILFNRNIAQLIYLIGLSLIFMFNWPNQLERFTKNLQYKPLRLVESIDSIYGNITVTKLGNEFSFYENGLLMFTSGDLLTTEESVHYAMLEHPLPKKILLIGGGISGSIEQILKHRIDKVDYVELDPSIIKLGEKYLPAIKDNRVNIAYMDGRLFVKKRGERTDNRDPESLTSFGYGARQRTEDKYDVVILNLPDPYTAMLNRFYSVEFFGEVKNILAQDGIFSFALSSSENYINPEHAMYLSCIYNTLWSKFKNIKILPGENITFLASDKNDLLTYDTSILIKRLKERKIHTKFVREYYLPFKLHPLRIKYIESILREFDAKKINQDFRPIGYFYHMLLWLSLFGAEKTILPHLEIINLNLFILIAMVSFIFARLIQKSRKASLKMPVALSVATTGMSEICFQVITLVAFQSMYGYMYYKIGIILTSFMIGLVVGSFYINRILEKIKDEISLYIKTQVLVCVYPIILLLALILIAKINQYSPAIGNNLQIIFTFLPIIAGFIGGFQFPLANKICLKNSKNVAKVTGLLYGVDLFGSCMGGLLIGIILIPVIGIIQTCILLTIINILALILLVST